MLAITKADLLDEELTEEIKKDLPNIPHIFISSVAQQGILNLKDMLWKEINAS
jgi:GTP-binding protein